MCVYTYLYKCAFMCIYVHICIYIFRLKEQGRDILTADNVQ